MSLRPMLSKLSPRLAPWCERRKNLRLPLEGLFCEQGRIANISLTGASIVSGEPLAGRISIRLDDSTPGAAIEAEVVWSRRIRTRLYETGVEFTDISAEAIRLLETIVAAHGRDRGEAAS